MRSNMISVENTGAIDYVALTTRRETKEEEAERRSAERTAFLMGLITSMMVLSGTAITAVGLAHFVVRPILMML